MALKLCLEQCENVPPQVTLEPGAGMSKLQQRRRRLGPLTVQVEPGQEKVRASSDESPLRELYEVLESLGQGSTGVVYRARRKEDGLEFAVKTMRTLDAEMTSIMREEYRILSSLSHRNIIQAHDFFTYKDQAVLVLDLFDGQPLSRAMKDAPGHQLPEGTAHGLFKMLLQAIDYLHERRIVHRDVKADNILVSKDLTDLRLVDFNTARRLVEGALTMTGTQEYLPPEVLAGDSPSEASDIWCAGLCLHLMLAGTLPQRGARSMVDYALAVCTQPLLLQGELWQGISAPCKATLEQCLSVDKLKRPAAMTLLSQEWLRKGCAGGYSPQVSPAAAASCSPALRAQRQSQISPASFTMATPSGKRPWSSASTSLYCTPTHSRHSSDLALMAGKMEWPEQQRHLHPMNDVALGLAN